MTDEQNARDIGEIKRDMVRTDFFNLAMASAAKDTAENAKDILAVDAKVEKIEERRAADRRLVFASIVSPILIALILLYIQSQIGAR